MAILQLTYMRGHNLLDLNIIFANNNLLTQNSIDSILSSLVLNEAIYGTTYLDGTGNASPSSSGRSDRQTLLNPPRDWIEVRVNGYYSMIEELYTITKNELFF